MPVNLASKAPCPPLVMVVEDMVDRFYSGPLRPSCNMGRRVLCAVEPEQLGCHEDQI